MTSPHRRGRSVGPSTTESYPNGPLFPITYGASSSPCVNISSRISRTAIRSVIACGSLPSCSPNRSKRPGSSAKAKDARWLAVFSLSISSGDFLARRLRMIGLASTNGFAIPWCCSRLDARVKTSASGIRTDDSWPIGIPIRPNLEGTSLVNASTTRDRPSSSGRGDGHDRMSLTQVFSIGTALMHGTTAMGDSPWLGRTRYIGRVGLCQNWD
mmetsp:Transcript_28261/g.38672  ORF Transcript_28261/g.38672 Transcript_28261/m.38672 type:complete len:213 (-) Transcript_28261:140-778(-)